MTVNFLKKISIDYEIDEWDYAEKIFAIELDA